MVFDRFNYHRPKKGFFLSTFQSAKDIICSLCPQTGQSVGLLTPTINTDMMDAFFEPFVAEVSPDIHVVMVWDQAGFHTSKKLKVPKNVTIVPLPPYSPELSPVENLWHYLRSH